MDSVMGTGVLLPSVSGFGHLRVEAWLAAHRSLTQPSHVLHRLSAPEHPPNTLEYLTTFASRISSCSRDIDLLMCRDVIPHPTCQRSRSPAAARPLGHRAKLRAAGRNRPGARTRRASACFDPVAASVSRRDDPPRQMSQPSTPLPVDPAGAAPP